MAEQAPRKPRFRRAPDEKRARILSAARTQFTRRSYEETTTSEIAREARVSEGTIFHHFGTKRALWQAVANTWLDELVDSIPFADDFGAARSSVGEFVRREGLLHTRDPELEESLRGALRDRVVAKTALLFDSWQQAATTLHPRDPQLLAQVLFPLLDDVLFRALDGDEPASLDYAEEAYRCVKGAVRGPP